MILLSQIADFLQLSFEGKDREIAALSTLQLAKDSDITFLEGEKYLDSLSSCQAGAILIRQEHVGNLPSGVQPLITKNPHLDMARLSGWLASKIEPSTTPPVIDPAADIHPTAIIGNGSVIGSHVKIGAHTVLGENVTIHENAQLYPNVTVYANSEIGARTILHAGAVIGGDGFGYAHTAQGEHIKIHHFGKCVLESDVEVGANSTIDRAVFGETRIKTGTKIDNLVMIAHNCEIGEHSIIVSQTGISGSASLGRNVVMGGQSATAGHLKIGDFATIAARGGVTKSIPGGKTYGGFPLMEHRLWLKLQAKLSRLIKS